MSQSDSYKAGLAVRKKVLGEKYVEESIRNADEFMAPLQQYLTEHAWGAVWVREGLSLKTRSMLNLAILTAINRPAELRLHIRGAMNNGVSKEEMREIFPALRRVLRGASRARCVQGREAGVRRGRRCREVTP
jgi:4-carboxymuconolactone decarboxylase